MKRRSICFRVLPLLVLLWLLGTMIYGCRRSSEQLDLVDERNPVFQRASRKAQEKDYEAAITLYREALRTSPRSAKAHLQLGMIYDDVYKDRIRAIYHYERYLELRPDAEKWALVRDWTERLRRDLGAEAATGGPERSEEVNVLKQEILQLRRELVQLRADNHVLRQELQARDEMPTPGVRLPGERGPEGPDQPEAASPAGRRTYTVIPGDTLWAIARRHNTSVEALQEANGLTGSQVRPGQTLVIPGA